MITETIHPIQGIRQRWISIAILLSILGVMILKRNEFFIRLRMFKTLRRNPVDKIREIVKGKYPILIICADDDEMVSLAENTNLFEKKIKQLNGTVTVIHKPGFKHHPHSLPNPKPIVDFVLKAISDLNTGSD
ncbi:MAG: hypothetical protein KIT80_15180 [Chitinophagaceae bacterium]|nr:hypothetical protein [Chitinophagaceae bacterium]MCW5928257.1 hypothetical protein [Chitinophagaceae bacterium]